jgi:hypothetical protein
LDFGRNINPPISIDVLPINLKHLIFKKC